MACKLDDALNAWVKSKGADTREKVLEVFALEQFFANLPVDLTTWLNDRSPKSVREAAEMADEYVSNRQSARRGENSLSAKAHADRDRNSDQPQARAARTTAGQNANNTQSSADGRVRSKTVCSYCLKTGHHENNCYRKPKGEQTRGNKPINRLKLSEESKVTTEDYQLPISINGKMATGLRDTGADITIVKSDFVDPDKFTGRAIYVRQPLDPEVKSVPLANIAITIGSETVTKEVGVSPFLTIDALIGNDIADDVHFPQVHIGQVQTRAQTRRQAASDSLANARPQTRSHPPLNDPPSAGQSKPLPLPLGLEEISPAQFAEFQRHDDSLAPLFKKVNEGRSPHGARMFIKDGLLYREWERTGKANCTPTVQLVVPMRFRAKILHLAHEIPLSAHVGIARVRSKVLQLFYWPGIFQDIENFVRSCLPCMKAGKGKNPVKAPLVHVPIIEEVFQRVIFDVIGPLPKTESNNRYAIVLCDCASHFPEVIPLPNIRAETIADALFGIFSRLGFPKEVQHDKALNFCNKLMEELWKKTGVKQFRSSAYNPQSNSLVERFNRCIKEALRALISAHKADWDTYIPYLLFALREAPCRTTGFSPFELLYGRKVRGPLDLLRESWDGSNPDPNAMSVVAQVVEMRRRLDEMHKLAKDSAEAEQMKQKTYYDKNARARNFKAGSQVLLLFPCRKNKLQCSWQGPYTVVQRLNAVDYVIEMNARTREHRVYHVNMMKEFVDRATPLVCYINIPDHSDPQLMESVTDKSDSVEKVLMGKIADSDISQEQEQQLLNLIAEFPHLFSDYPGRTDVVEHKIQLTDETPVKKSAYRTNPRVREIIREEVDSLLEQGLIYPSNSDYGSPMIIVERPGKSPRAVVDYRDLNAKSLSDAFPMKNSEDLIDKISGAKYISVFDMARGYHQINLEINSQRYSAFATPFGLYQFKVMPFGLKTAAATFQRAMNKILDGAHDFADSYYDDLAVFSDSWEQHLMHLRDVFTRLSKAGLTIRPEKTQWAGGTVTYLGFQIGSGIRQPSDAKVKALTHYPRPTTKKELRGYLGFIGYYSGYIANHAERISPLTDMLRRSQPDPVEWTEEADRAFREMNETLISSPILAAPQFDREFIIQTDASKKAIGAVISQNDAAGNEHPIAYSSRKLTPSEQNWSVIEKELLSIVHAITKFKHYVYGTKFTVVTDHNPLRYLKKMSNHNAKLMRWSLILDQYDFQIQYRKGSLHKNADALSRIELDLY